MVIYLHKCEVCGTVKARHKLRSFWCADPNCVGYMTWIETKYELIQSDLFDKQVFYYLRD